MRLFFFCASIVVIIGSVCIGHDPETNFIDPIAQLGIMCGFVGALAANSDCG